jgi:hypothetical protein
MGARLVLALAITVALVIGGVFVAQRWLGETPRATAELTVDAAPPPGPAQVAPAVGVTVTQVTGAPERLRANQAATPLKLGDVLAPDDTVRTGDGDGAKLRVGDVADVEVASRSQFSIGALTAWGSHARLGGGRISAVVHGDHEGRLRVETADGAAAESKGGAFSLLAGDGHVTLATTEGRAQLSARGRTVDVNAGFQATARKDAPPSAPTAIPPSLFIKLAQPRATVQREKQTVVSGRTTPAATVTINGEHFAADERGDFSRTVPLREGKNVVRVDTEDVLGRHRAQTLPSITVDSTAPEVRTTVKW